MEVKDISLSSVNISEFNTRKDLDAGTEDAGLEDLAISIKEKGLLNPVLLYTRWLSSGVAARLFSLQRGGYPF